jgi:hypothetical protein
MIKRALFICLALVLMLTVLLPGAALAKDDQRKPGPAVTDFSGSGLIYVTNMPEPSVKGDIWRYQGEIVEGFLLDSDWDLLAYTAFWSEHDSIVNVGDDGSARGIMKGTFKLARPDGSGVLEGTFEGRISGNLFTGNIADTGTWKSTGASGVFKDVKAWGSWSTSLSIGPIPGTDIYTLIGPVTWEGKYSAAVKPPAIGKPGKPFNPWEAFKSKSIKPWRPIKPGKH